MAVVRASGTPASEDKGVAEQAERGLYQVRLEIEMHGDWAVQIDLRGAVRDRVIAMLRFEETDVADV